MRDEVALREPVTLGEPAGDLLARDPGGEGSLSGACGGAGLPLEDVRVPVVEIEGRGPEAEALSHGRHDPLGDAGEREVGLQLVRELENPLERLGAALEPLVDDLHLPPEVPVLEREGDVVGEDRQLLQRLGRGELPVVRLENEEAGDDGGRLEREKHLHVEAAGSGRGRGGGRARSAAREPTGRNGCSRSRWLASQSWKPGA